MQKSSRKRTNRKKPKQGRVRGSYHGGLRQTVVMPQRALAPSMLITATFQEQGYLTSGTLTAARQWTPNSFYDCQPASGGNKWNEYDQWSALYTEYRVLSYKYYLELVNTEGGNYPIQYYILQTDSNPGTTVAVYQELAAQRKCTSGQVNFDPVIRTGGSTVDSLIGEKSPDYADTYRALMTADPSDKVWLSLGATFSNSVSNNGLMYRLRIVAKVRIYGSNAITQVDRPSGLTLEARRLAYKQLKEIKLRKDNEQIEEKHTLKLKERKALLEPLIEKERKELEKQQ